jgi:hypothetical protein
MVSACVPYRIAAAYSSGSVKMRTELDVTLPSLPCDCIRFGPTAIRLAQEPYHLKTFGSDFAPVI